jgi:hypothetical protein
MAIATMAATGATASGSAPGVTQARKCHAFPYETVLVYYSRNISCKAASRDLKRTRGFVTRRRFTTHGGFKCRRIVGGELASKHRCRKGHRAYRFSFSD